MANDFSESNLDNDVALTFGTSTAYKMKYDSGDTRLEFLDGADNILAHLTDAGTTGNLVVTGNLSSANVLSSTYTPTITGVANVTSSVARVCQYMRVGNVITVSGSVNVTHTAATTYTRVGVSLPVSSNLANAYELGGSGGAITSTTINIHTSILGDATNNRAEIAYISDAAAGAAREIYFTFTYQVI